MALDFDVSRRGEVNSGERRFGSAPSSPDTVSAVLRADSVEDYVGISAKFAPQLTYADIPEDLIRAQESTGLTP